MIFFNQNKAKKALAILMPIIFLGALNFCLVHPNVVFAEVDSVSIVDVKTQIMEDCQHGLVDKSEKQQSSEKDSEAGSPIQNSSSFCCVVHNSAKTETGSKNHEFSSSIQSPCIGSLALGSLEFSNESLNLYSLSLSPPKADLLASILKKE